MKKIYLAGGCFWGTAHLFSLVEGVESTVVGYANSRVNNPSYEEVCSGDTYVAETVEVVYDHTVVGLSELLVIYFRSIDPLSVNRQGDDHGTQYRTGIYYTDPADLPVIEAVVATIQRRLPEQMAVEVKALENFWPAEDYHQDYLYKNPTGYCHVDPSLFAEVKERSARRKAEDCASGRRQPDKDELLGRLTPLQWEVTQRGATERPFDNEYDHEFRPGIYVDIIDGTPLFISSRKYDSGCGWPAFTRPIGPDTLTEHLDTSFGRVRTEVKSASSGAHLGHVFTDGPASEGGLRYCINSAALRFIPADEMAAGGYGDYLALLDD